MKKIISLLLTLLLLVFSATCFTGCESRQEKAMREANERLAAAKQSAQRAADAYNDLKEKADAYQKSRDRLNTY